MISSQPLGGDGPPKRGDGEPPGQRDGPARNHGLPYDRPDRLERYDRPRPIRRDSRAGPDLRERDWRRASRPTNQYSQTSASLHSLNRRDDRSGRDRLMRERKRFERPRDRMERPERYDHTERGDQLDRRSGWQHTSAPYVRENGQHSANGNGRLSHRHSPDDDFRMGKTYRAEPRFTRRPGDSFWDLMGHQQRPDKARASPDSEHDDRRFKKTERPQTNGHRPHDEDHSRSVSPDHSQRSSAEVKSEREPSKEPVKEKSASREPSRDPVKEPSDSKKHVGDDSRDVSSNHQDSHANDDKQKSEVGISSQDGAENTPLNSIAEEPSRLPSLREENGSKNTLSTSDETNIPQLENGKAHSDLEKPVSGSDRVKELASETNESADHSSGDVLPRSKDTVAVKESSVSSDLPPSQRKTEMSVEHQPVISTGYPTSSAVEEQDTQTTTAEDKITTPGVMPQSSTAVENDELLASSEKKASAPVPQDEDVEMTDEQPETTDVGQEATEPNDVETKDEEMSDVHVSEPAAHKDAKPVTYETFLHSDTEPNVFSVEQVADIPAAPQLEPSEAPSMNTPQETQQQNYLIAQYDHLSSEVKPNKVTEKKWSLSIPDPRVSFSIMAQQAELQEDILLRQREFAERKQKWLMFCKQLDDEADMRSRSSKAEVSNKGENHSSNHHARRRSKDVEPEAHRRNRERSRAHGDVARSEAEFLEILANLEAETARDPLVRARQTSARIPPQRQQATSLRFRSTNALILDHSELTKRLKTDAVDDFTAEEHERFVEAYVKSPKEFGLIADAVGRGFNECVMHYYRTKKQADYKRILQKRRKSKRGRKPKKKEQDDEAPTTPLMDSASQFESPGTPKTPSTTSDAVAVTTTVTPLSPGVPSSPASQQQVVQPVVQPMSELSNSVPAQASTEPELQPAVQPLVKPLEVSSNVALGSSESQNTEVLQQVQESITVNSRIPPPVLPLTDQAADFGASYSEEKWTPSAIARLEQLFGVYGSRLDDIAQHMGRSAESIRSFYEQNHQKYLSIIQKTDSANSRSKPPQGGNGPNAGFFPPRSKVVPVAKALPVERGEKPSSMELPVKKAQIQQSVSVPTDPQDLPPVVQPPGVQQELLKQPQQAHTEQRMLLEPRVQDQSPISQRILLPEVHRPSQHPRQMLVLPSIKSLSLSVMPVLPCLPNPRKLADPLDFYHLEQSYHQYRESNERRRH